MLTNNQRLAVRINERLRCLEFTLYEYYPFRVFQKPYMIPFEDLRLPVFDTGRLLESLQSEMPSRGVVVLNG